MHPGNNNHEPGDSTGSQAIVSQLMSHNHFACILKSGVIATKIKALKNNTLKINVLKVIVLLIIAMQIVPVTAIRAAETVEDHFLDARGRPLNDSIYDGIRQLEERELRGIELYRAEKYEPAYETLAEPARHGLKNAQHSIALMHLMGQGIKKNLLVGTALFGLAAESGDRKLKREHKNLMKAIPKKYKSVVQAQTDYYIQRYGMAAQGIKCERVKNTGSNLMSMLCQKQPGNYKDNPWTP